MNENTEKNNVDLEEFTKLFHDFSNDFKSIQLATVGSDGFPESSYAPFLKSENDFYVYVSELSKHTGNMMDNGKVSLLMIEHETQAKHLFARKRITYRATAVEVVRDSEEFSSRMQEFEKKFGKFMGMLRNLHDFHLFRLKPEKGNFVAGFARAFHLEGSNLDQLRHVNDVGHTAANKETEKQMEVQA